ncbi:hypothetical protein HanIR_Chr08g0368591 [Helianthus annuus]|nr:hypothetical protein HanIR_Chr08g0368591 [Helianthus annuus]
MASAALTKTACVDPSRSFTAAAISTTQSSAVTDDRDSLNVSKNGTASSISFTPSHSFFKLSIALPFSFLQTYGIPLFTPSFK